MKKVIVIDYKVGNLLSIERALEKNNCKCEITSDPEKILNAERVILPGVGAFGEGMNFLKGLGLIDPIQKYVKTGKPLLGICLGMQILFSTSEEFDNNAGLDIIPGSVEKISDKNPLGESHKVPHVGWGTLVGDKDWSKSILDGLEKDRVSVYFVHSFAAKCKNPNALLAATIYDGLELTAAVHYENVWGVQFHPEKSGPVGLQILQNFTNLT